MEKIPITIIGGGVVGCAIAWELSKYKEGIFIFEKNTYLAEEQSARNSGVIHAGIYYKHTPLKRKLCIRGKDLLYDFCKKYNIPHIQTGKIIVATDEKEEKRVDEYIENCLSWGVPVKKLTKREIKEKEPNVEALCGLFSPTTGIIDVATYVKMLVLLSKENKVEILTQTKVVEIKPDNHSFIVKVEYPNKSYENFKTGLIINAAGLYSDEVAKMLNPTITYEIKPVRGEYFKFNSKKRKEINFFGTNIYPVEQPYYLDGKLHYALGVHLTPTFELKDNKKELGRYVLVGPSSTPVKDKADYEKERKGPEYFVEQLKKFFPTIDISDLEIDFAGNRAKLKNYDDFIIEKDKTYPNAIHLIGIDSPGLTSSLAIAEYVVRNLIINY